MVDSNPKSGYRSLSADSELSSAYNYLRNGEYKQCKRTIDKKLPKLKSDLDKVNFNIVKLLLLNKTKKLKEAKKLIEFLKKEFTTNQNIASNQDLSRYFIGVLRELDEEQIANEIYKFSLKNLNLAKISRDEQTQILKQLTQNFDFSEVYTKINSFLKNENDADKKFLTLLKYEIIYILAFRQGKISKTIVNLTLKEMINNYSKLSEEKGFVDILIKYLTNLRDSNSFLNLFENKKVEFTNAPLQDLFVDIYLEKGDDLKLLNSILKEITNNLNEWNFVWYERLVNSIFYLFKEKFNASKGIPDVEKIFGSEKNFDQELTEENFKNFEINSYSLDDVNSVLNQVYYFFDIIHLKLADRKTNLNAYKSAILAKLLIFHQIILWNNDYNSLSERIKNLVIEILDNSVNKQSILHEVSKFFIYLTNEQRTEILNRFVYNTESYINVNYDINSSDKEKIIFFHKLEKMFIGRLFTQEVKSLSLKIDQLVKMYFVLSKNQPKLEKGERLIVDDLMVLVNEYFFDFINQVKQHKSKTGNSLGQDESFVKLTYTMYSLNSLALERSPYNYDISIFSIRLAGYLNLPGRVLEILKYMNLKGPQFETVSYIAFPYFLNNFYKPGLIYLAESIEKWENDNKKSIRSTLWKMFTGRNFWNSEELLQFLTQNEESYYKFLMRFLDLLGNFNDNLTTSYEDENLFKEAFAELTEIIYDLSNNYEAKLKNGNIHKNQDLVISLFKYKEVKFFEGNFEILRRNVNYNSTNYKFKIDSLSKNNLIYQLNPSFKNNFLIQDHVEVFGIFDQMKFLSDRMLNKINFSVLTGKVASLSQNVKEIRERNNSSQIESVFSENFSYISAIDKIERTLFRIFTEAENNFESYLKNEEEVIRSYLQLKENVLDSICGFRQDFNIFDFNSRLNFNSNFLYFKNFSLFNLVVLTSKFLDLINDNKKSLKDSAGTFKIKINNSFKSPILNLLSDNVTTFESLLHKINSSEANEFFFSSFSVLSEDGISFLNLHKDFIFDSSSKFLEEQRDQLKSLIETSKLFKNYVKENI